MCYRAVCSLLLILGTIHTTWADDWPQWLGPQRDGEWREDGIVEQFPDEGLTVKWRVPVALGYSGPAVADGRVYVMDYVHKSGDLTNSPGGRNKVQGNERVLCFDVETGKKIWTHEYERPYFLSYPRGPRCTPAVHSGRVYTLGAEGDLSCLNAVTGKEIWSKALTKEYQFETPVWGVAAHPLVDGDLLYCVVGGKGSVAVAFDKVTGREVWRNLTSDAPGYCPPTMIEHGGVRQLLIWHPDGLNSLNPLTGEVYWSDPLKPGFQMSVTAPRKSGRYLFASAIGQIGALYELDDNKPAAELVWTGHTKNAVYTCNSTPFIENGMIYGCDIETGALLGVRMRDGKRLWETREPTTGGSRRDRHANAFLVKHEDRFFLFNEKGDLILADLTPQGYKELSRFHVLEPTNEAFGRDVVWSHPAFAERSVFARNDRELVRVDLAAKL